MNSSVYIETSVIGYLTSWPREDPTVAGHQNTTTLWWSNAGDRFDLFVSQLVVRECSDGDPDAVSASGIDTLTTRERRILEVETRRQRMQ